MALAMFEPRRIDPRDRFGIAVPVEGGSIMVIKTFPSREQLETGYNDFYRIAKDLKLALPLPIEYIREVSERGVSKCKVLVDMIKTG